MNFDERGWQRVKETLLLVTVVYFYALALALIFGKSAYGLDHPVLFFLMGGLFLTAIGIELGAAWWSRRRFIVWAVLGVVTYGAIGLIVAPMLFGDRVLLYVLVEPLAVVLIGGFAFSIATIMSRFVFGASTLSASQIADALRELPGWELESGGLTKEFTFPDAERAQHFMNVVKKKMGRRIPTRLSLDASFGKVRISIVSSSGSGIGSKDVDAAKAIDQM